MEKNNIISDWLDEHGGQKICQKVGDKLIKDLKIKDLEDLLNKVAQERDYYRELFIKANTYIVKI